MPTNHTRSGLWRASARWGIATTFLLGVTTVTPSVCADEMDDLVSLTLAENPDLTALEAEVEALSHKSIEAASWRDPTLSLAYQNVPVNNPVLGEQPMSMLRIQLGQTIPFPGKTDRRRDVVLRSVDAKRWQLEELRVALRAEVQRVYYQLALTRQLRHITEKHIDLVEQLIATVRIKYEVGRASQQDLLRLELLRDRLEDDLGDFDRSSIDLEAQLNSSAHRKQGTPITTPGDCGLGELTSTGEELATTARAHNPMLKRLDETSAMYRAEAELADAEVVPDPTVFAAYGIRADLPGPMDTPDLVTVGVSVPIPVLPDNRFGARQRAALARARAVEQRRERTLDEIDEAIVRYLARWQRAVDKVDAYQGELVPDAQATLDATMANYQVDRADFTSLFEAQLALLQFERTVRIAIVEGLTAIVALEAVVGKELR